MMRGLDIFNLTPKSNCKKCQCPTCMAFAMKVAGGALSIRECPYIPLEDPSGEKESERGLYMSLLELIGKSVSAVATTIETNIDRDTFDSIVDPSKTGGNNCKTAKLPFIYNPNGVLIHIEVSDVCSGCGACSGMSNLFIDGADGKAVPVNGGVTTKDRLEELQEAVDMCPDGAISLAPVSFAKESGTPTVADLRALVENILVRYEYPRPKYDDYKWTSYRPDVDGKGFYGWSRYDYSSYREAERAGVSELERVIFDHIDAHISTMLAEYKHEQLTPLITYTEDTNNFYYRENLRIKNLIQAIMLEVEAITKKKLANEIDVDAMNLVPDFGYNGKNFDGFYKIEEQTGMVKGDLESPDWYSSWVDTDDMDTTERGMFGGTKTVTKWAFRANGAMKEIFSHLNSGGKSEMRRYFEDTIKSRYQFAALVEPMEEEVRKVGRTILSCLTK